jgi:hypothetical protein
MLRECGRDAQSECEDDESAELCVSAFDLFLDSIARG